MEELDVKVLSALRRSGSTAAVRDFNEELFTDDTVKNAFIWMRTYVMDHRAFPNPGLMKQVTTVTTVQTREPLSYYVSEIRNRKLYWELIPVYGEMQTAMEEMDPSKFMLQVAEARQRSAGLQTSASDFIPLGAAMDLVHTDYQQARLTSGLRGVPTYWPFLNEITAGWQNGDLFTIVGRPGTGKTYLMLLQAYAAWRAGHSVLFVSMELGALQLARRLFGIHAKLNPDLIRRGRISAHFEAGIQGRMSAMDNGVPFNIIVGGFKKSIATVRAVAEATEPDLILVDAAYLLKPDQVRKGSESRREKVSDTIEGLKQISLDLDRPVGQSVQFNRTVTPKRKTPKDRERDDTGDNDENNPVAHLTLEGIGETDIIGQASSIVIGTALPQFPFSKVQRWLALIKGREGEQGIFKINYSFNPVNFDLIQIGPDAARVDRRLALPDVSFME